MTAEERVAELEHRLGMVEDELAIRRLQHAYGYYLDKCYYDEVVLDHAEPVLKLRDSFLCRHLRPPRRYLRGLSVVLSDSLR